MLFLFQAHAHWFRSEEARIHQLQVVGYLRLEFHQCQNVFFQVNAGRDLDERRTAGHQFEDCTFGDVEHVLPAFVQGILTGEGYVIHVPYEFYAAAVSYDAKLAVLDTDVVFSAGGEGSHEAYVFGSLGYIDEASRAGYFAGKPGYVDIAVHIYLG